jgi:hypothetical protein
MVAYGWVRRERGDWLVRRLMKMRSLGTPDWQESIFPFGTFRLGNILTHKLHVFIEIPFQYKYAYRTPMGRVHESQGLKRWTVPTPR